MQVKGHKPLIQDHRLNSKLKARDVEIKDLIKDLSDGVRDPPYPWFMTAYHAQSRLDTSAEHHNRSYSSTFSKSSRMNP